jgi:hypothetical protein
MVQVNTPGGGIEQVTVKELLWMRDAFDSEWKGTVMLRLTSGRIYSAEKLENLATKFRAAAAKLADFTPPEGRLDMVVNAAGVTKVAAANAAIDHPKAKAVLSFGRKIRLAVRETPEVATQKIKQA